MHQTRSPMIALAALTAALAMPLAFAQTTAPTQDMGDATTQATPAERAPAEAESGMALIWADLDTDQDGTISRQEAARVPGLAEVFDEIDADGDGLLTAEEYQAYAARTDAAGADDGSDVD